MTTSPHLDKIHNVYCLRPCYDHHYGCFSSILADSEPSYENDVDADDDDVYDYNATPAATQTMANKHKKIKCNKKLLDESVSLQNIFQFTQIIPSLGIRIIINAPNSQSEPEAHHNRLYKCIFVLTLFIPAKINLFQLKLILLPSEDEMSIIMIMLFNKSQLFDLGETRSSEDNL